MGPLDLPPEQRAIHESAHALLAYLQQVPICWLSIVPIKNRGAGRCVTVAGPWSEDDTWKTLDPAHRPEVEKQIRIRAAGEIAERLAGWSSYPEPSLSDNRQINEFLRLLYGKTEWLSHRVVLVCQTEELLSERMHIVGALAAELAPARRLRGAKVVEIIEAHGGEVLTALPATALT